MNLSVVFVFFGDLQISYCVLIVEDYYDMCNYLFQFLFFYFEVEVVLNGQVVLFYLEQLIVLFDFIFLDVMMFEMDGYELLYYLKQSDVFSYILVVMLIVWFVMADWLKVLCIGVDDYFIKFFIEEEFLI